MRLRLARSGLIRDVEPEETSCTVGYAFFCATQQLYSGLKVPRSFVQLHMDVENSYLPGCRLHRALGDSRPPQVPPCTIGIAAKIA